MDGTKRKQMTVAAARACLAAALGFGLTSGLAGCARLRKPAPAGNENAVDSREEQPEPNRRGLFRRRAARRRAANEQLAEATNDAPSSVGSAAPDRSAFQLRAGLILNVTVLVGGQVEIAETGKRVSDSGTIALPLLGPVRVEGHTLDVVGKGLSTMYSRYFVNPQVMVDLVHDDTRQGVAPWGYVTVLGRVKKPGRIAIPATRDLTVSQAIQQAGGFDTSARANAIRVTRRNSDGTQTGMDVDLQAAGARGELHQDMLLQAEDVVFVPERLF